MGPKVNEFRNFVRSSRKEPITSFCRWATGETREDMNLGLPHLIFRIVQARGEIPNEVGPTRQRAVGLCDASTHGMDEDQVPQEIVLGLQAPIPILPTSMKESRPKAQLALSSKLCFQLQRNLRVLGHVHHRDKFPAPGQVSTAPDEFPNWFVVWVHQALASLGPPDDISHVIDKLLDV